MSAVLYDVPGPKARTRNALLGVAGVAAVLALLGYMGYRFYATGQFDGQLWDWLLYKQVQLDLIDALVATLEAFAAGAVLALAFGAVLAVGRLSDHAWLRAPSTMVVEFFRAIPLLIMIFIFYYGLPLAGLKMTPFMALVLGLTLYNGSVLAEVFRAGIQSLPKGQGEAAYALGMRKTQVMTLVLMPQALRAMLPAIISQLVVLLKDTALGFLITYNELLHYARFIGSQGTFGRPLVPATIVVGAIYITVCLLLTALATYLEGRNRRNKKTLSVAVDEPQVPPDLEATLLASE